MGDVIRDIYADIRTVMDQRFHFTQNADSTDEEWTGSVWADIADYIDEDEYTEWVEKAAQAAGRYEAPANVVLLMVPLTWTSWWAKYVMRAAEVLFVEGVDLAVVVFTPYGGVATRWGTLDLVGAE
jgi:hypothetical protein